MFNTVLEEFVLFTGEIVEIKGNIINMSENDGKTSLIFNISIKNRFIQHNCEEYTIIRKSQKKLCEHLARLMLKLYANNNKKTLELVRDLSNNRDLWQFK